MCTKHVARGIVLVCLVLATCAPFPASAQHEDHSAQLINDLVDKAVAAQQDKDWTQAEVLWRKIIAREPSAAAWGNLGNVLKHENKLPQAVDAFERGLRIAPRLNGLHLDLGLAYYAAKKYAEAIPPFMEFLRVQPDSLQGWQLLGLCQLNVGRYSAATASLSQAEKVSQPKPDISLLYALASSQIMSGDTAAATHTLDQMVSQNGDAAGLHLLLGEAEANEWHNDAAREELEKAYALDPHLPNLHLELGLIAIRQNRPVDAIQQFSVELQSNPLCSQCYLQRGICEHHEQMDDAALKDIEEGLTLKPNDADALYALAEIQVQREQLSTAIATLGKALDADPNRTAPHYLLGRTLIKVGRTKDGMEQLRLTKQIVEHNDKQKDQRLQKDFNQVMETGKRTVIQTP